MKQQQKGFTLVEIAVVLVIIGLLLGAILQGQQLIQSARVSNLSDQQAGIQAAYFGFIDRYRAVPGDMPSDAAQDAIGEQINGGGLGRGRLPSPDGDDDAGEYTDHWSALNGVWEQLAKAGFIRGSYTGVNSEPNSGDAPENAFNALVLLSRHDGYEDANTDNPPPRLLFNFGENIPASIARELDQKLDDGRPDSGSLRNAENGTAFWQSDDSCTAAGQAGSNGNGDQIWDVDTDFQNCNPVFIY